MLLGSPNLACQTHGKLARVLSDASHKPVMNVMMWLGVAVAMVMLMMHHGFMVEQVSTWQILHASCMSMCADYLPLRVMKLWKICT